MALNFGKLNFSTAFNPTAAFPLDARCYFESLEAAQAAVKNAEEAGSSNTTYYFGLQVAVVEEGKATLYIIQPSEDESGKTIGVLEEVGSKTLGDDKSISLENGELSLKNFGKWYYKYIAETEETPAHYERQDGFIAGLQPQVEKVSEGNFILVWYEPNPTTVEGLSTRIAAVEEQVARKQDILTQQDGIKIEATAEGTNIGLDLEAIFEIYGGSATDVINSTEVKE